MILYRVFNIIYRHPLVFKLSKLYAIESHALQVMHQFTDDVIRKRRSELLTDNADNGNKDEDDAITTGDDVGMRKKRALLDILLHSTIDEKPLTDLDIREEVDNFMFAVCFVCIACSCHFDVKLLFLLPENKNAGFIFHAGSRHNHISNNIHIV